MFSLFLEFEIIPMHFFSFNILIFPSICWKSISISTYLKNFSISLFTLKISTLSISLQCLYILSEHTNPIFIFSITLYPYVYIISRAAFSEISNTYTDIGRTLGLKQANIFFKVILPLAIVPILGGVILSILESLNDFGTVQYYGINTFTTGIYKTWVGLGDINLAAQISIFFLFFIFIIIFLQKRFFFYEKKDLKISSYKETKLKFLSKSQNIFLIFFCLIPPVLGFFIPFVFLLLNSIKSLEFFILKDTIVNTLNTVFLGLSVSFIIIIFFFYFFRNF